MRSINPLSSARVLASLAFVFGVALVSNLRAGTTNSGTVSGTISRPLDEGWRFRSIRTPEPSEHVDWSAAVVPGVVQGDLLRDGLMADPNYGLNEQGYQWAGLSDWEYRTTFSLTPEERSRKHVDLVFEGLDTFADVYLNGERLLQATNMFRRWRLPLDGKLHSGGTDELRVVFHSPVMALLDKVKALPFRLPTVGQVLEASEEKIATDPYTRKAPYQYGWDFNPRLVTEGIWQPVRLESWDRFRLDDFHIHQRQVSRDEAGFDAELSIEADSPGEAEVEIDNLDVPAAKPGAGDLPASRAVVTLHPGVNRVCIPGAVASPKLWWPNGYGAQSMYRFKAVVRMGGTATEALRKTGFRSVELRREEDAWGKSFGFVVNGVPIFAKGASVVPLDVFPERNTPERLRPMLAAAREAHMNMLRVWGGGVYEPDAFYEICDELGLMVWQDFMFGGAMVPNDPVFRENVGEEARWQVTRLRDHPSIALWCGNNEVEQLFDRPYFKKRYGEARASEMLRSYLLVFDDVIKSAVTELGDPVPYWPSTPSSASEGPADAGVRGDMHSWTVWYQNLPAETYTRQFPRFMSEYGFESLPEMDTLRKFAPEDELKIGSATMTEHQKSHGAKGNQTIADAVLRDYGQAADFPSLVYLSQIEQADAVRTGAEHFRRQRPRTMGSLYWALQDGWPCIYSSSIDYYGHWKALQWYARRFYAELLVSPWLHEGKVDVFAISDRREAVAGSVRLRVMDFHGKVLNEVEEPANVPALSSVKVFTLDEPRVLNGQDPKNVFALAEWIQGGRILAANELFFLPVKELALPKARIACALSAGQSRLTLTSDVLARDVSISFDEPDTLPDDDFFDLLPNRPVELGVRSPRSLPSLHPHVRSLTDALTDAPAAAKPGP